MTELNHHDPAGTGAEIFRRMLAVPFLTEWANRELDRTKPSTGFYRGLDLYFRSALRSEHVSGDNRFSARRRANRVTKHTRMLRKGAEMIDKALEALPEAFADHEAHMRALPAQREAKAQRKAGRRDALTAATSKSLHKSVTSTNAAATEIPAAGRDTAVRGVTDLWNDQKRKGA
ncbi:hypothetical protein ACFWA1_36050 [Streptomyces sp. NPDC060005]|uniref:hypothetical protein n=1 Tax=Streptomyces sp. NPDC060005 TaxID=3347034 RepID=UPI0036C0A806